MPSDSTFREETDFHGQPSAHHDFDFTVLDTIEDRIREAIAKGVSVTALVSEMVEAECNERTNEAIAAVISYISDAAKPRMAADHIAWISGMRVRQGESIQSIAKRHGVSKQAFCQSAIKLAALLNLKPARAMRSEISKTMMQLRHFKRTKTNESTD